MTLSIHCRLAASPCMSTRHVRLNMFELNSGSHPADLFLPFPIPVAAPSTLAGCCSPSSFLQSPFPSSPLARSGHSSLGLFIPVASALDLATLTCQEGHATPAPSIHAI